MLFCLVSWLLLAIVAALVGSFFLEIAGASNFRHFGDRLIVALWLGIVILSAAQLALSLLLPLSPGNAFTLILAITATAASSRKAWGVLNALPAYLTTATVAGVAILAAIVAVSSTQPVELVDTGLYHYQFVRWLSEYGTIPGLALIHSRFGFSSSWFALAAPFDFGPFRGRTSGLLDGLTICLALVHFSAALSRILQRRAGRADWFLAGGYPLIFLVCLGWTFEDSLSPDLPVWILTLLIGWLMMGRDEAADVTQPSANYAAIVPMIFALGAMDMKLSAAPLLAVAGLFFWFCSGASWLNRLLLGGLASLLAVPLFAANVVTSGCPLFPSSPFCVALPWTMDKAVLQVISRSIRDFARWGGPVPGNLSHGWFLPWVLQVDKLALLPVCLLCLVAFGSSREWRKEPRLLWSLGLSAAGAIFVFVTAPNVRFAIGYLAICPALLLATTGMKFYDAHVSGFLKKTRWTKGFSLASLIIVVGVLTAIETGTSEWKFDQQISAIEGNMAAKSRLLARLFLPPPLPHSPGDLIFINDRAGNRVANLAMTSEERNGIAYFRPSGSEQCWAVPLPCSPDVIEQDVYPRRPNDGMRYGFMRSTNAPAGAAESTK